MSNLRRLVANASGAAAVEYALVVGPLLLLFFGVFEFGRFLWTREALNETAIAGARCMGLRSSSCANGQVYSSSLTTTYVQTVASSWTITIPAGAISLNANTSCGGTANFSSVALNYTFQTAVPLLISSLSGGIAIAAQACFPNQS